MEHFIIGTAGHVDHGKTALIKALTGKDTDSMPEEKKRGISIDLGFTYFSLPNGHKAGIIDVPGHEKYISNMLTGVCGMDLILLVIAADEGLMPQTWEHIEIIKQLKIYEGIIVLTKCDLVEDGWPELMMDDIKEQLADSVCAGWPSIAISVKDSRGINELISLIENKAENLIRNRNVNGQFRMPIDRVLSPKGIGTVVAGTLLEGSIQVDDEVMLYPQENTVRIKSMQVHGEDVQVAYAGQRVALLLPGIDKKQIKRGQIIGAKNSLILTDRLNVRLVMAQNTARTLKNQTRVHVHIGALETIARVVLIDKDELSKCQTGLAQLIFSEKVTAKKGDNFVIRFLSPLETIGGGAVICLDSVKRKRYDSEFITFLSNIENSRTLELLQASIAKKDAPVTFQDIALETKLDEIDVRTALSTLCDNKDIIELIGRKNRYYIDANVEKEAFRSFKQSLQDYDEKNPYSAGITTLTAKTQFLKKWQNESVDVYLKYLKENKKLKINVFKDEAYYSLFDRRELERPQEDELKSQILNAVNEKGFDLVEVKNIKHTSLSDKQFEQYLGFLVRKDLLVEIKDDFYTSQKIAREIIKRVNKYFEESEIISFSTLRDLLGTSRKSAKPIMAWLDFMKVTAWCGKETERKRNVN